MKTILIILFNLYIIIFIARLLITLAKTDYFNPICKTIYKLTQPLLISIEYLISKTKIKNNRYFNILIIIFLLQLVKIYIVYYLLYSTLPNIAGAAILSTGIITKYTLEFIFYLIIARIFISWLSANTLNSYIVVIIQLTEPLLYKARQAIPAIMGFDLSPILVLMIIKFAITIIANPIISTGISLSI